MKLKVEKMTPVYFARTVGILKSNLRKEYADANMHESFIAKLMRSKIWSNEPTRGRHVISANFMLDDTIYFRSSLMFDIDSLQSWLHGSQM